MQATNELRFVEREIKYNEPAMGGDYVISGVRVIKVLQQKWVGWKATGNKHPFKETEDVIEWRDVPTVKEQSND